MKQSELDYFALLDNLISDLSAFIEIFEAFDKSQQKRDDATIELLRYEDRFLKAFKKFIVVAVNEATMFCPQEFTKAPE